MAFTRALSRRVCHCSSRTGVVVLASRACGVAMAREGWMSGLLILWASMMLSSASKMSQGFMDIRPLKIQVKVVSAKTRPRMWCQRRAPGAKGEREPLR